VRSVAALDPSSAGSVAKVCRERERRAELLEQLHVPWEAGDPGDLVPRPAPGGQEIAGEYVKCDEEGVEGRWSRGHLRGSTLALLDYGSQALLDTFEHLSAARIAWVGAGPDAATARAPRLLTTRGMRLAVLGASDHPEEFAAGPDRPGIAYANLREHAGGGWLTDAVAAARRDADAVLVTPHWGPNMTVRPSAAIRRAARALLSAGTTLVAGHSAHVPHGSERGILYDLGDFVDDYAVDPRLRNDLGLLFLVDLDAHGPRRLEAVPLTLEHCHTRMARGGDADWISRRFVGACAELGTAAIQRDDLVVITHRT
jgi:hypothetical protein